QVARACVWTERLPLGEGRTSCLNRGVDIGHRSLGDAGKLFPGRWIVGVEELARRRLDPGSVDEVPETVGVPVEPAKRFFRLFRRGAVLHGDKLFSDAHLKL